MYLSQSDFMFLTCVQNFLKESIIGSCLGELSLIVGKSQLLYQVIIFNFSANLPDVEVSKTFLTLFQGKNNQRYVYKQQLLGKDGVMMKDKIEKIIINTAWASR